MQELTVTRTKTAEREGIRQEEEEEEEKRSTGPSPPAINLWGKNLLPPLIPHPTLLNMLQNNQL